MKYIKSIFENSEEDYITNYGLTPDDIKDMFVDIQDEGYIVSTNFSKKLFQWNVTGEFQKGDMKFGLQPVIQVRVKKQPMTSRQSWILELSRFLESDLFKETISVAKERLKGFGWKIKDVKIEHDYIIISISKINI